MKSSRLKLEGLCLLETIIYKDERGFFTDRYHQGKFKELGLDINFVQDNHSRSKPGILRGLHYQYGPGQGKLVGVVRGKIWDIAVDIRRESPTFGQSYGAELSDENGRLLWIPGGFAHGFCVLGVEPADVLYKVDTLYNPKNEGGILWNDPELNIEWPMKLPQVSLRDTKLSSFADYKKNPVF